MTSLTLHRIPVRRSDLFLSIWTIFFAFSVLPAFSQTAWNSQKSNTTNTLRGVAFGGGQFVAVGDNGTLLTSPDGKVWKLQNVGTAYTLYSVAYGMGQFVAVGENTILTSSDGLNWTAYEPTPDYMHLRDISYGNGQFVAVAGFSGVLSSTNGKDWSAQPLVSSNYLTGISFGGGKFVIVGNQSATYSFSIGKKEGTWKSNLLPVSSAQQSAVDLAHIHYGADRFVAVGANAVFVSPDGLTWNKASISPTSYLFDVTYGAKQFVAVGYNGRIQTSPNGTSWTTQSSSTKQILYAVCFSEKRFVAVGATGTIISSDVGAPSARLAAPTDNPIPPTIERSEEVLVYPNPSTNGRFNLSLPKDVRRVSVISAQGHTILDWKETAASSVIDISRFVSGMYWLRVETTMGFQTIKLIKQ